MNAKLIHGSFVFSELPLDYMIISRDTKQHIVEGMTTNVIEDFGVNNLPESKSSVYQISSPFYSSRENVSNNNQNDTKGERNNDAVKPSFLTTETVNPFNHDPGEYPEFWIILWFFIFLLPTVLAKFRNLTPG